MRRSARVLVLAALLPPLASGLARAEDVKEPAAAIVERVLEQEGVEAATARLGRLLADAGSYLFDDGEFVALARRLSEAGDQDAALEVLTLAAEALPDSPALAGAIGRMHRAAGREELAVRFTRRALRLRERQILDRFLSEHEGEMAKTAEEVIERHIEAIGGRKALAAVKTMVVRRSNHDSVGQFSSTVHYYKRPGRYRVDEEGIDASSYVTDGKNVWRVRSGGWTESDYTGILHEASIDNYMFDYRGLGVRYEWAGIHVLNSRPVYHLRRIFADGYRQDLFFSVRTGFLTEIKYTAPLGEGNLGLWRYRDVGGFLMPHVIVRSIGDVAPPHGYVVEEVRINEPLDDGIFHPPEGR